MAFEPGMPYDPEDAPAPDRGALRRRVLLTAVVTFVLFLAATFVIDAARASSLWIVLAVALIYVLVVRPMMAPVREVTRLRRRLAYQAFLEAREDEQEGRGRA